MAEDIEMIVVETKGPGVPAELVLLADEIEEDPRCQMVTVGAAGGSSVLVSLWDAEVATEVEDGIRASFGESTVRRFTVLG